jgi:N-acetylmuramoyl-L-alanine amidase
MSFYIIKEGDCIESIAFEKGLFWEKIWNHPKNAKIKNIRQSPRVLMEGDELFIPEPEAKQVSVQTDQRSTFVRKGVPCEFHVVLKEDDSALANVRYVLQVDSQSFSGNTKPDGSIKVSIPPNAHHCKLTLGDPPQQKHFTIELGHLDPVDTIIGIKQRLSNLGFNIDDFTNEMTPKTEEAIRKFQSKVNISVTGEPDEATQQALIDHYKI